MKINKLRKIVKEVLKELSVTGGVAGYQTPNAFAGKSNTKNKATKFAEKIGYKTVKQKQRPFSTKLIDYLDENVN